MKKDTYDIAGMHCRSCEIVVEDNISKIPHVNKAVVDHKTGQAQVYYEGQRPDESQVAKAVRAAGYVLGKNKKLLFFSRDIGDYVELVFVATVAAALYIVARLFGLDTLAYGTSGSISYPVALLIGLTAGVSTCAALVGGLILGVSARHAQRHPEATRAQRFYPHLFFNLGRLVSFAALGGLIGLIGSGLRFSGPVLGGFVVFAGLVMLFLGLQLVGIFPRMSSGGLTLPKGVARLLGIGKTDGEYSHKGSFVTGALTFFLPCGFTQAVQLYVISTGSFTQGALVLFLFALGTAPALLGIGGLTSLFKGYAARLFFKLSGVVVVILAVVNISSGYTLTGIILGSPLAGNVSGVTIENGTQVVRITQSGNGYSPNKITVRKDIPVKLLVNATNIYSCAATMVIPKFKIATTFKEGLNEIEFTPTETGPVRFSCSMGMFGGVINVIN